MSKKKSKSELKKEIFENDRTIFLNKPIQHFGNN